MATRSCKRTNKKVKDRGEKLFGDALMNLENIARQRIETAADPFSVGIKMASQLRELAMKLEREVDDQSISATEASHVSNGMLGVGV
ncbi:MAG TPA: hypothetical protein PLW88_03045 [Syntrophorhabdaceae bacterium]|nr:hypothetical protein [Syntrophorhabdaceae bacterium]HPP06320.1 hypothetical protein [Syntrophorhabdaceae bacterium]